MLSLRFTPVFLSLVLAVAPAAPIARLAASSLATA